MGSNGLVKGLGEVAKLLVSDSGWMVNGNVAAVSGGRVTFDIRYRRTEILDAEVTVINDRW